MYGFISGLYSIPLVSVSILVPITYCFDYHYFVISFEIGKCESSLFFFRIIFLFWVHCDSIWILEWASKFSTEKVS